MHPLDILLVSSSSGSQGGGELYLVALAEGLSRQGHRVAALLSDHSRMDRLAGLLAPWAAVHRHPYRATYDRRLRSLAPAPTRRLARLFERLAPQVIHVNKQNVEDGLDLLAAAGRSGIPAVATIHITRSMTALDALAGPLRDRVSRRVLRRARLPCIAIAEACRIQLSEFLGPSSCVSLHRVWNGVPAPQNADRPAVRAAAGLAAHHFVLGCAARLEPQKNPLFLLDLLAHLPSHVRLLWIGDGTLRKQFLDRADRLGLADRVMLTGWCPDAPQRLAALDLFVLPSQYEGLPLAILEAMALGLPCLVSDVDGVREAVVDHQTGRLCRYGDQPDWLTALRTLIADPASRLALGAQARDRYQRHFSLDAMARGTVEVYRNLLRSPRSTGDAATSVPDSSPPVYAPACSD